MNLTSLPGKAAYAVLVGVVVFIIVLILGMILGGVAEAANVGAVLTKYAAILGVLAGLVTFFTRG